MKMRIALSLLLTVMCLGLASTPLMAGTIFTTGGPEQPSPVGFAPFGPPMPDNPVAAVSFDCPASSCIVQGISFWDFSTNGSSYTPTLLNEVWLGPSPYSTTYGAFSAPLTQTSCISGVTNWCNEFINVHADNGDITVPGGISWLTLYGENVNTETAWSNAAGLGDPSTTLSLDPTTGLITGYPSSLAFSVFGQVGTTPEPSSILLLGSGILGLAGVLRRKMNR
jgi:PEP-CTERM motif